MPGRAPSWIAAGLVSLVLGCTSSAANQSVPADAEAICPTSLSAAMGASCATEGLVCSPEYPCGILPAIATCTCTAGAFACTDVTGKTVDEGGSPECPAPAASQTCPATETLANLHACSEPGLMCPYPSTCSLDSQEYDLCQCFTGAISDGGTGLRFECTTSCDYDASPIDAESPADATVAPTEDSSSEARSADAP